VAATFLWSQPAGVDILQRSFRRGEVCPEDVEDSETTPITFASMAGLFYICAAIALAALLLAAGRAMTTPPESATTGGDADPEALPPDTEGRMLRLLLQKVDRLMDEQALSTQTDAVATTKAGRKTATDDLAAVVSAAARSTSQPRRGRVRVRQGPSPQEGRLACRRTTPRPASGGASSEDLDCEGDADTIAAAHSPDSDHAAATPGFESANLLPGARSHLLPNTAGVRAARDLNLLTPPPRLRRPKLTADVEAAPTELGGNFSDFL